MLSQARLLSVNSPYTSDMLISRCGEHESIDSASAREPVAIHKARTATLLTVLFIDIQFGAGLVFDAGLARDKLGNKEEGAGDTTL